MNLGTVAELFERNFAELGEVGASLSIWHEGREVLGLAGGHRDRERLLPWTADTPVLVWSATKGPASACLLHACQEHGVSLDAPVAECWPEFAAAGKARVTIAQVLSHQAGLAVLSTPVPVEDHAAVVAALVAETPHWPPGSAHGYHPRTMGFLADELVRRIAGVTLGEYWRRDLAGPCGWSFWIGMNDAHKEGVAPILAARSLPPSDDGFYREMGRAGSFTQRAFTSPRGLHSVSAMNTPDARTASLPAFGGIGTAHGLGAFYSELATGDLFQQPMKAAMETTLVDGPDRVLLMPTAFSAGFMKDPAGKARRTFGPSSRAFGQPGAGGSLAFADPENGMSFAYVMNQMEPGVMPGEKALRLVRALYS